MQLGFQQQQQVPKAALLQKVQVKQSLFHAGSAPLHHQASLLLLQQQQEYRPTPFLLAILHHQHPSSLPLVE
jgi:hypothetical protein